MVSRYSAPGSPTKACMSTSPGATTSPPAVDGAGVDREADGGDGGADRANCTPLDQDAAADLGAADGIDETRG